MERTQEAPNAGRIQVYFLPMQSVYCHASPVARHGSLQSRMPHTAKMNFDENAARRGKVIKEVLHIVIAPTQ
jgi:hypothetical protein